jgi:hypothetical protein
MNENELDPPPEALTDPDGFEILRLWAAHQQLHVALSSDMQGGAEDFGELLADLFEHAARMYAQRDERELSECRAAMLEDFMYRIENPNSSLDGSLPVEH